MNHLYACIENERDEENLCFIIIRNFSINEISNLFEAVHVIRNITFDTDMVGYSFMVMVPTIVRLLLEDLIEDDELYPYSIHTNIEPRPVSIPAVSIPAVSVPVVSSSPNSVHSFPIPEEEEIVFLPEEPEPHYRGEDYGFPTYENETTNYYSPSTQESNTNVDTDDIPPLMDISGNIIPNEFFVRNTPSLPPSLPPNPIQIILNKTIKIVPQKNVVTFTEETNCPVCYEGFQENKIIKTDCGHCFCFDCVTKFTKHKNNCPMCRGPILQLNMHMNNLV
jgi:hypothetical protein